jgi:hypothetical protein
MSKIFISYSHKDKVWKDRVVTQLGVLAHGAKLELWDDHRIAAGDDWLPAIEKAIQNCDVALLLISADFLTSNFILKQEIPTLLERRAREGVRLIPVILRPCAWTAVSWLKGIQARPINGKPLTSLTKDGAEKALADLTEEVLKQIAELVPMPKQEASMAGRIPQLQDRLHFSATAPRTLHPGSSHTLDVWAHLEAQREEVRRRDADQSGTPDNRLKSQGPVKIVRGTEIGVQLSTPGLLQSSSENVLLWDGEIANAGFTVTVPEHVKPTTCPGEAILHVGALTIAKLAFVLEIAAKMTSTQPLELNVRRFSKAYASYAQEDRAAVLVRIQAIQKVAPNFDIFCDVAKLRSDESWQERIKQEILSCDVMFLFWSAAASRSKWVDWEWRYGYQARGTDFITPVPLASPDEVPPPKELAELHFNDWVLAYMRGQPQANDISSK